MWLEKRIAGTCLGADVTIYESLSPNRKLTNPFINKYTAVVTCISGAEISLFGAPSTPNPKPQGEAALSAVRDMVSQVL